MSEALPVITISTDAVSKHAATEIVTDNAPGRLHCRGPLDGSLYAKVNKNKKCENGENHCVEKDPCASVNQEENAAVNQSSECANPQNPNVVVLNGNKIVFKPQSHPGSPTVKAPLANLNEFNSLFSLDSCVESYPSFSTVTKLSVTSYDSVTQSSAELLPAPPGYQEIMADGPTSQAVSGEVLGRSSKSKRKAGDKARFSEVSSCSATTLGSTTSGEDGPQMELSDNDTSDSCSIHEVQIQCIEGALSPLTVQGSVSSELFAYSPVKDTRDITTDITNSRTAPTTPAPAVPRPPDNAAQNSHGILSSADYNKSSEYAVPMRDMKITTVTSKRAVLVSTGSEHDMASPSADRRDSVYDEGNTYNGAGYSTIEEYEEDQHSVAIKSPESNEHSYIPEDVQELLNGLTEYTPISDIDSGFHGSSMALQSTSQRGLFESNNMTSQSSSEASDSTASPAPAGDSPDASPNRGISGSPDRISPEAPTPGVAARVGFFDARATQDKRGVAFEVRKPSVEANGFSNVTNVASVTPKKNTNPGVPIPTQTYPEPQPAQVQVITMRNVYTDGQSMAHQSQSAPAKSPGGTPKTPTTLKTQPSTTAYQQQPAKTVEKPPLPPTNTEPVTMRRPPVAAMSDDDEEDLEDELDVENIRSMEEQIKHTQRHLEFLREQQEKLKKRKQDRTKYRETLKRNSTNFERYSQGYNNPPVVTGGLHAYHSAQDLKREVSQNGHVAHKTNGSTAVDNSGAMPAIANVNPGFGRPLSAQHVTSQSPWNGGHDANHRRNPSYTEVETARQEIPKKSDKKPVFRRHQDKDDIIMSSDLQEQLAELDKCIAELTTNMDIPSPRESVDTEPTPPKQQLHNSQSPPSNTNLSPPIPSPPRRSKSSFDSYKRLSHDFDPTSPRKSSTDPSSPDDVFSPAPQTPRSSKKQNPFPPQTNVTRRQQTAPPPPPKRRMSLEERLSPILVQALASNPGAKPKEDIHSYREDLAPEAVPATPTFPTTPSTPYVNSDSPVRSKSPPGLVKTPLSMLHLRPTDTPQDSLSPHEPAAAPISQTSPRDSPAREDTVDGIMKEVQEVTPEPQFSPAVALQNGLAKETDLITDDAEPKIESKPESFVGNGQVPNGVERQVIIPEVQVPVLNTPEAQPTPPTSLDLAHANHPNGTIVKAQINRTPDQGSPSPLQQYLLHNSSGSHSSHSPAATSSNSRRESSDSLDGPSTRHSNSSVLSSSSSSSATHNATHGLHGARALRPGSQLSNYDRHHLMASGTRSGDESLESPRSGRTSSSSISDAEKMNQYDTSNATVSTAPKFIRDTTAYWYKPNIVRDEALAILRPKPAGSFIVRDSRCFPGAFGLALKVDKLPTNVQLKPGADIANEYVRHFLIEPSSRGVKLKGCPNEPVFGSLSALVYQHSITPLALPCKLIIPTAGKIKSRDPETPSPQARQPEPTPSPQATAAELLKQGAACNVIYLGSVDTESLTGPLAIERAIRETYQVARSNPNSTSIVHFKVTPQGITLTDNARKLFFRKHYPTETVTYCGLDPLGGANKSQKFRRWDATGVKGSADAWLFGFVARKQAGATGNTCLVFAELDPAQPARAVVNFVMKVLIGFSRQNSST